MHSQKTKLIELSKAINSTIPSGAVVPRHTIDGHFYEIGDNSLHNIHKELNNPVYPSVTGKLSLVKDPSIQNFAVNEAMRYVEAHIHECVSDGEMDLMKTIDLLHEAKKAPKGVLTDAGDIGTKIHDRREEFFNAWIDNDWNKPDIEDFIDRDNDDPRVIAGMLGLDKFCKDSGYLPLKTELMVYDHDLKVAGMLDDLGMIGDALVIMDLKTSNRFKDVYFLQVALYYYMFEKLTGLKPERAFILKVDKNKPKYQIEEIKDIPFIVDIAKKIIEVGNGIEKISEQRAQINSINI